MRVQSHVPGILYVDTCSMPEPSDRIVYRFPTATTTENELTASEQLERSEQPWLQADAS